MIRRLCLISACSIILAGCKPPKPVSSLMTDAEEKSLEDNLAKLDATLQQHAPYLFATLAPPATDAELAQLRTGLDGAQIEVLEVWYKWHNGCTDRLKDVLPLGRMLSVAESLDDRRLIQKVPLVSKQRKSALKILDDGSGDGFFLDIASPQPRVFYDMLEDPGTEDYGTLNEFVQFIIDVHAAGLASQDKNGLVQFDLKRYNKMEADYLRSLGNKH